MYRNKIGNTATANVGYTYNVLSMRIILKGAR